jgi:AbrB family looped-hinge helix DNA binding protein
MSTTTLSKKYQIVVPKAVRKSMGLHVGEEVALHMVDQNRAVLVRSNTDPVSALSGLGKDIWKTLGGTEKYIKSERASWKK